MCECTVDLIANGWKKTMHSIHPNACTHIVNERNRSQQAELNRLDATPDNFLIISSPEQYSHHRLGDKLLSVFFARMRVYKLRTTYVPSHAQHTFRLRDWVEQSARLIFPIGSVDTYCIPPLPHTFLTSTCLSA